MISFPLRWSRSIFLGQTDVTSLKIWLIERKYESSQHMKYKMCGIKKSKLQFGQIIQGGSREIIQLPWVFRGVQTWPWVKWTASATKGSKTLRGSLQTRGWHSSASSWTARWWWVFSIENFISERFDWIFSRWIFGRTEVRSLMARTPSPPSSPGCLSTWMSDQIVPKNHPHYFSVGSPSSLLPLRCSTTKGTSSSLTGLVTN